MHRIAKFHFVSPGQFLTAMQEGYPQYTEAQIKEMYENLKLPRRESVFQDGLLPEAQAMISSHRLPLPWPRERPSRFLPAFVLK